MEQQHMFTNRMIRNLLVPVVLEQILNSIMGTADTMMVRAKYSGVRPHKEKINISKEIINKTRSFLYNKKCER